MIIRSRLTEAVRALEQAGVPDARLDAEYLLAHVMHTDRLRLRLEGASEMTQEQERQFASLLLSRTRRIPLQYLLGTQLFYGLPIRVDSRVLIPRPETEELCEWGLGLIAPGSRVLDLCTGSGAIAIAMKTHCPGASVSASDLSEDALALARENAAANDADITFSQGDLWEPLSGLTFDLILSNPPYIPTADCRALQPEVQREPLMALDGGNDGLDFYRRIAREAPDHLVPGGWVLMEAGIGETEAIARMLTEAGLDNVTVRRDLYGVPRMVGAQRRRNTNV